MVLCMWLVSVIMMFWVLGVEVIWIVLNKFCGLFGVRVVVGCMVVVSMMGLVGVSMWCRK